MRTVLVVLLAGVLLGDPATASCRIGEALDAQFHGKPCKDTLKLDLQVDFCFVAQEEIDATKRKIEAALGSPVEWLEEDGATVGTHTSQGLSARVRIESVNKGTRRQVTATWIRDPDFAPACEASDAPVGPAKGTSFRASEEGPSAEEWLEGTVVEPEITRHVDPCYPELARVARLEANVILQATIGEDGVVADACVLRCNRPGVGFEAEAVDALLEWRYKPATLNGHPIAVTTTIFVEFKLH